MILLPMKERVRVVVSCVHLLIHHSNTLRPSFQLIGIVVAATASRRLLIVRLLSRLLLILLTIDVIALDAMHEVFHAPIVNVGSILCITTIIKMQR